MACKLVVKTDRSPTAAFVGDLQFGDSSMVKGPTAEVQFGMVINLRA